MDAQDKTQKSDHLFDRRDCTDTRICALQRLSAGQAQTISDGPVRNEGFGTDLKLLLSERNGGLNDIEKSLG
jgi:hypothetical protein